MEKDLMCAFCGRKKKKHQLEFIYVIYVLIYIIQKFLIKK